MIQPWQCVLLNGLQHGSQARNSLVLDKQPSLEFGFGLLFIHVISWYQLCVARYAPLLASISKIAGPDNVLAICVLASRGKEDSAGDPVEDEHMLSKKMMSLGFGAHARVFQDSFWQLRCCCASLLGACAPLLCNAETQLPAAPRRSLSQMSSPPSCSGTHSWHTSSGASFLAAF